MNLKLMNKYILNKQGASLTLFQDTGLTDDKNNRVLANFACPYASSQVLIAPEGPAIIGSKPQLQPASLEKNCGNWCALFEAENTGDITEITQHCCKRTLPVELVE